MATILPTDYTPSPRRVYSFSVAPADTRSSALVLDAQRLASANGQSFSVVVLRALKAYLETHND